MHEFQDARGMDVRAMARDWPGQDRRCRCIASVANHGSPCTSSESHLVRVALACASAEPASTRIGRRRLAPASADPQEPARWHGRLP
eukprot:7083693-Pyramimonas_sp.AAC.1